MSDWQIGDLALCVDDRVCPFWRTNAGLVQGKTYAVVGVMGNGSSLLHGPGVGLTLDGVVTPSANISSARFRKILPDKHEPCEAEFVALLKREKVKA